MPGTPLKENEVALDEFRQHHHDLETAENEILNHENYGRLIEINSGNDASFRKYAYGAVTTKDNILKESRKGAKQVIEIRPYDMNVFKQDMKNCRKVVDTGHSLCLKNNESNCYKHDWKLAVDGVKKLNGLSRNIKSILAEYFLKSFKSYNFFVRFARDHLRS